jgi:hypothetical protein
VRIIQPNDLAGPKGNKSPVRPDWFVEWLANQGKWVLLECGCIEDVHLPTCITLLTGKTIVILCPFDQGHGMVKIKKTLKLRDVLKARGITIPDDLDPKGLFPPF